MQNGNQKKQRKKNENRKKQRKPKNNVEIENQRTKGKKWKMMKPIKKPMCYTFSPKMIGIQEWYNKNFYVDH